MNKRDALGFCGRGWSVFRVQPGRKTPLPGSRGLLDASADSDVVGRWWDEMPDANIGLALGASGLFCVDIEVPEHEWLDPLLECQTFTQCTASGGWHFVFRQPEDWKVPTVPLGALDDDAEIRGDGGYILLAPSQIYGSSSKTGLASRYQLVDGGEVALGPAWLMEKISTYMAKGARERAGLRLVHASIAQRHTDASSRLDELRQVLMSAVPGQRNHTLRSVACSVGRVVAGGYVSASDAEAMLEGWVSDWPSPRKNQDCIQRGVADGMGMQPWYPDDEPLSDAHVDGLIGSVALMAHQIDSEAVEAVEAPDTKAAPSVQHSASGQSTDDMRQDIVDRVAALSDVAGDFVELCESSAMYWQPAYAVASAIALGSVMGARRVVWPGRNPLTTSCYLLIAGDSAEGKSTAKAAISMCLDAWSDLRGGDTLGSAAANFQAIRMATDNGHGQIWVLDEYYKVIEAMANIQNAAFAENRAMLLEMATINTGTFRRKKSKLDSADGTLFDLLHVPGFSVLALSATEKLFQTLGKSSVADGFVPRHLLFMPQSQLPKKRRGAEAQPSARLMAAISAAKDIHASWVDRLGTKIWDGGHPVDVDDDARGIIADFGDGLDEMRREGRGSIPAPILGRGEEQAQRVAMCLAQLAQAGSKTLRIDAELAFLACDIVAMAMRDMASALAAHTYDSQYERHLGVLLRALERHAGVDGWVPWSKVLQACRVGNSQYIGQLVQHLAGAGEIEVRESGEKTQGPKAHHLRVVKK